MAAQYPKFTVCESSDSDFITLIFDNEEKCVKVYQRYKKSDAQHFMKFKEPFTLENNEEVYFLYEYTEEFEGIKSEGYSDKFPPTY